MPITIDQYSLVAKPLTVRRGDIAISVATGFTWATSDAAYLVTNWHVVTGMNPITGKHLDPCTAIEPDHLVVQLDLKDPIGSRGPMPLPLYADDGDPIWLEHPSRQGVDVVCIRMPEMPGAFLHPVNLMPQGPIAIGVGIDSFIIGYPFGLKTGAFPIWKRASIASEPEMKVEGAPFFYVDTASRPGMSGSPVIARTWAGYLADDGTRRVDPGPESRFLGVYAGRFDNQEEKAQVGRVWHARAIDEIIEGQRRGAPPWAYNATSADR